MLCRYSKDAINILVKEYEHSDPLRLFGSKAKRRKILKLALVGVRAAVLAINSHAQSQ